MSGPAMGGYFMPVDRRDIARDVRENMEGLWSWSPQMEGVTEELKRIEHFGADEGSECVSPPPSYPCQPGQKCPDGASFCPDSHPYYCGCGVVSPGAPVAYKCCKKPTGDVREGAAGYGCDCHKKGEVAPPPKPWVPAGANMKVLYGIWQKYPLPILGIVGLAVVGLFVLRRKNE